MNTMQTEYETYGDYDAFTDYSAGPTYTREDLRPGTVFDAEDEGGGEVPDISTQTRSAFDYESQAYDTSGDSQEDTSPGSTGPGGSDEMGSF